MKIGILQAGHSPDELRETRGDYGNFFERLLDGQGFSFEIFSVVDGDFPQGPDVCDGWLITGSKHAVYEDHPWIAPLETLIRDVHALGRPMVGICFGHQIIAQALGGKVEKFEGGWAVGRQTYHLLDDSVTLNAWHQDQVVQRPDGAVVIGSNAFCENAALVYGDSIFTVQPHPEFDATIMDVLINVRGGAIPPDLITVARSDLEKKVDNDRLATQIGNFLKGDGL